MHFSPQGQSAELVASLFPAKRLRSKPMILRCISWERKSIYPMHRVRKVFFVAFWIIIPPLVFAVSVTVIRPNAKDKGIDAQRPPEATLFFAEQREQNKTEATEATMLHPRLQEAIRNLKEKRKISRELLMNQLPIAELKKLFEEGDILWAPSEAQKHVLTEQDKRIKEEEARLKDEKLKENKVRNIVWVTVLIITPPLIFAALVALTRPKAKNKRRTVEFQGDYARRT